MPRRIEVSSAGLSPGPEVSVTGEMGERLQELRLIPKRSRAGSAPKRPFVADILVPDPAIARGAF
jgi:hypothetical protein